MTFGEFVHGVTPSLLTAQRRVVAAAAAPASGIGGQNLDLALMLADGSPTGRVDPAFEAHTQPIGHWAQAEWNKWLPATALLKLVASARVKLTNAMYPWQHVHGPGAGFLCTAARLNWIVHDGLNITTDRGRALKLDVDPPKVVIRE